MLIKKIFFVLITSLCVISNSFAGIRNAEDSFLLEEDDDNVVVVEKKNKFNEKKKKKKKIDVGKFYNRAKNAYWLGNFDDANTILDAILAIEENQILTIEENQKINELKNKIMLLEEKKSFFKREIITDYSMELKRTIKESNFYEGYLFLNKILKLSPNENVAYSKSRLDSDVDTIAQFLYSKKDRNMFKKSIEYFSSENFSKAKFIIDRLCEKYPKFLNFEGVAEIYQFEEENNHALNMYYKTALNAAKNNYMYKAKNYIDLAYSIRRDDIKVLILMEQINMELM